MIVSAGTRREGRQRVQCFRLQNAIFVLSLNGIREKRGSSEGGRHSADTFSFSPMQRAAFALRLLRPQHQLASRTALASGAGISVFLLRTKTGVARPGRRGEDSERFSRPAFTARGTLVDSGALSKSSARPSDVARASAALDVPASGGVHATEGRWPPACPRRWPGRAVA